MGGEVGGDNTLVSGAWPHLINSTSRLLHTALHCIAAQAKFGDCLHVESIAIEHFPNVKCTLVRKVLHVQSQLPKKQSLDQNCFGPIMEVAVLQMDGVNECKYR